MDWLYSLFSTILYDAKVESREFSVNSLDELNDVAEYEESGKLSKSLYNRFCARLTPQEKALLTITAFKFGVLKKMGRNHYMVPTMAELAEDLPVAEVVDFD